MVGGIAERSMSSPALRRRLGLAACSGSCRRCFALLSLLLRLGLLHARARFALHEAGGIQEPRHAVGRLRADRQPVLGPVHIELHAICTVLWQEWIVCADLLDIAAI